ncbi:PUA-like domain-containing protein [Phlebopus sp. FC_14]|nr:PUA-like domain-containing protein [Phlebopus sp. FC_14]
MTDSDPVFDTISTMQSDLLDDTSPIVTPNTSIPRESQSTNQVDLQPATATKNPKNAITRLSKTFGHIPGIHVGASWPSRQECSNAGVHRSILAGICGTKHDGANSIVLSNMYDDNDCGETIIYTGAGGRKRWSDSFPPKRIHHGPQIYDQKWTDWGNTSLVVSEETGQPVRVVRGHKEISKYAPAQGYRYDGLYTVVSHWMENNSKGLKVCRYRLERIPGQPPIPEHHSWVSPTPKGKQPELCDSSVKLGVLAMQFPDKYPAHDASQNAIARDSSPRSSNSTLQKSIKHRHHDFHYSPYRRPAQFWPIASNSHSREQTLVVGSEDQAQQPMEITAVQCAISSADVKARSLLCSDNESLMGEEEDIKHAPKRQWSMESTDFGPISLASQSISLALPAGLPVKQHDSTSPEAYSREPSMKPEWESDNDDDDEVYTWFVSP